MSPWTLAIGNLRNSAPREPVKYCKSCDTDKPLTEFYVMGSRIGRTCKPCHKAQVYARRGKE